MKSEILRKSILQYAIQGKLVPQDPNDEPASVLLEKIKEEKQALIKQGKLKKEKPLPPIKDDDIQFEIPDNWIWVRLGDYLDIRDGTHATPKYVTEGFPLITSKNLNNNSIDFDNVKYISKEDHYAISQRSHVDDGDILFAMIGSIGNPVIVKKTKDFSIKNVALFKPILKIATVTEYVYHFLLLAQEWLRQEASGGVQSFVSLRYFRNYLFPFPPLAEQHRIVERIEKLMILVDEYEKKEIELNKLENEFPEKLKKSILQYAVQGKLTKQLDIDEPASILLKKIIAEKQELIKQGKIKKEKLLPPITDDNIPFDIPVNWAWVRLGDLCNYGVCYNAEPNNIPNDAWLLELEDIEKETGVIKKYVTKQERICKSTKHKFYKGQVLYGKLRPYLNKVLVANSDGYCTSEILPISFGDINPCYVTIYLRSPFFVEYANSKSYGVKMPRLGTDDGKNALFPLPPLEEQERIVTRIAELLKIVDTLTAKKEVEITEVEDLSINDVEPDTIKIPTKKTFDFNSLEWAARQEDGIDEETIADMKKQVEEYYAKKN